MTKEIRYNVPNRGDPANDEKNFTLHTDGITVYFDLIEEHMSGFTFRKEGVRVAFLSEDECDVSPKVAKSHAGSHPGEKVRFADN